MTGEPTDRVMALTLHVGQKNVQGKEKRANRSHALQHKENYLQLKVMETYFVPYIMTNS